MQEAGIGSAVQVAEGGADFSAGPEGLVESAIRVEPRGQEIGVGRFRVGKTDRNELAIGLEEKAAGALKKATEVLASRPL